MAAATPAIARLAQSQLDWLETCPRQFQHAYLDCLGALPNPAQQARRDWGERFHLLMQQRELGVPVESFLRQDPQLERALNALLSPAPELFAPQANTRRAVEHRRSLRWGHYLLSAIYDLLAVGPDGIQIVDWKTHLRPQPRARLAAAWQTRLYRYILAETADCAPERITMTYWFVGAPAGPSSVRFDYSQQQHAQTGRELQALLEQLDAWWTAYRDRGVPFPQVPEEEGHCTACRFAARCQRSPQASEPEASNWASVGEVAP